MTSDAFRLANRMTTGARAIEGATRAGVNEAARSVGHAVDLAVKSVLGSDARFSSARKGGGQWPQVKASVRPAKSVERPIALVVTVPEGFASMINSGAKKHMVGVQNARGGRVANVIGVEEGTGAIITAGRNRFTRRRNVKRVVMDMRGAGGDGEAAQGPFMAGGFPATHAIDGAFNLMAPRVADIVQRETSYALVKAFK